MGLRSPDIMCLAALDNLLLDRLALLFVLQHAEDGSNLSVLALTFSFSGLGTRTRSTGFLSVGENADDGMGGTGGGAVVGGGPGGGRCDSLRRVVGRCAGALAGAEDATYLLWISASCFARARRSWEEREAAMDLCLWIWREPCQLGEPREEADVAGEECMKVEEWPDSDVESRSRSEMKERR